MFLSHEHVFRTQNISKNQNLILSPEQNYFGTLYEISLQDFFYLTGCSRLGCTNLEWSSKGQTRMALHSRWTCRSQNSRWLVEFSTDPIDVKILKNSLKFSKIVLTFHCLSKFYYSEIHPALHTIQVKLILLCVWAERAFLGSAKTALKFKYVI